jgi:hypothetical protein
MPDEKTQPQEIVFPNENAAKLLAPLLGAQMASLIEALGISPPPKNLILLIGGADKLDERLASRLTQLFSRGIARAAADAEALIIDGGTQAGVMQIMGQSVIEGGRKSSLLGVAPAGKVTYPGGPPVAGNGSAGMLLAAVGAELWVALTTALATAMTTRLASRQLEQMLVCYNKSAVDLENVRDWWTVLSPGAKRNPKNIDQLVEVTERVLETELSSWVRVAQLKPEEEKGEKSSGDKSRMKNEVTPPTQPVPVPPKAEPADSPGHEDT